MTMPDLPAAIARERVVAVARRLDVDRARGLAAALIEGGLGVVEVTVEAGGGPAAISAMVEAGLTVGAGTVMTVAEARDACAAGATFLVSPHTDVDVLRWALEARVPYVPGVLTPTEVVRALRAGARTVKLFPASLGGPAMVAALRAPFPDLAVVPTGGVSAADAAEYLAAGALAVGIGGWLTDVADLEVVVERARVLRAAVGLV